MDLYRYFHPHHNPRLCNTPVRLQELGELEQAAVELKKAVKRAAIRSANVSAEIASNAFNHEHFSEVLAALEFVVDTLSDLTNAHPGDGTETMHSLLSERGEAPGWENWSRLLKQRLDLMREHGPSELDGIQVPATKSARR